MERELVGFSWFCFSGVFFLDLLKDLLGIIFNIFFLGSLSKSIFLQIHGCFCCCKDSIKRPKVPNSSTWPVILYSTLLFFFLMAHGLQGICFSFKTSSGKQH